MKLSKPLNFNLFKKIPVTLQTETGECGLACLSMILAYYGGESNLFDLRSKYGVSSRGTTLQTLLNISHDLGLTTLIRVRGNLSIKASLYLTLEF